MLPQCVEKFHQYRSDEENIIDFSNFQDIFITIKSCLGIFLASFKKKTRWPPQAFSLSVMKSAYISLIIGPRGLVCKANQKEIMGWESSDVVRFDLGSLLQGQTRIAKLKSAYTLLIIGPRGLQCETNLSE